MKTSTRGFTQRRSRRVAMAAFAAVVAVSLCLPAQALAYFSKPAVGIYFGTTYLSMTAGSSNSVGLTIDPASEQQLPGCGMSICPQACNGLETPEGVMGGCLNELGWCTCAGTTYYTAYTQVSVSSSNPYVARASANGGSLSITAVSPGTATITVYASLSKHVDSSASITVEVAEPATTPDPTPTPTPDPGTPAPTPDPGNPSDGSGGSGSSSSGGSVSVSAAGNSATAAAAAAAAASDENDEKKAVELEAEDGTKVIVVKASDAASAAEELAKIAGTEGTCTFWSGGTLDSPAISWTFKGTDLSEDSNLEFDPTVTVSKRGTGDVAKLLGDVKNAIVMDFAHSGELPTEAEVYVRASGVYEDGDKLGLYMYDEEAKKFELAEEDIEVADGYAVYSIDHCSVWALSDENLAACEMPAEEASSTPEGQVAADEVNVKAQDGTPFIVGIAVLLAAVVVVIVVVALRRRKAAAPGAEEGAAEEGAASEETAEGEDSESAQDSAALDADEPVDQVESDGLDAREDADASRE